MKISYYELLGMIKEKNIPNEVYVKLQRGLKTVKYVPEFDCANDSLTCYSICNEEEIDENYHNYLTDCFIEMSAFDKCIEIIEEEKEIEKLDVALLGQCDNWLQHQGTEEKSGLELNPYIIANITENTLYFQRKINELIDEVNKLKKE